MNNIRQVNEHCVTNQIVHVLSYITKSEKQTGNTVVYQERNKMMLQGGIKALPERTEGKDQMIHHPHCLQIIGGGEHVITTIILVL